jgi:hypothetical protein
MPPNCTLTHCVPSVPLTLLTVLTHLSVTAIDFYTVVRVYFWDVEPLSVLDLFCSIH